MVFLFKLWIFEIDFTAIVSLLLGLFLGFLIACSIYLILVLSSLNDKKYLVKTQDDSLTAQDVKDMIVSAQVTFKDNNLRGDMTRIQYCKNISMSLIVGIASKFYPKSKHPLLELSVDELLVLLGYVKTRLEEVMDRKVLRLLKGVKVSFIADITNVTNKVVDSKAFKITKEASSTVSKVNNILNIINPVHWIKKTVVNKTLDIIICKLCEITISIVGEETYKIYSKTVFNEDVEIEGNVEELLTSIQNDITDITDSNDKNTVNKTEYKFKNNLFKTKVENNYQSNFDASYPMLTKNKVMEE